MPATVERLAMIEGLEFPVHISKNLDYVDVDFEVFLEPPVSRKRRELLEGVVIGWYNLGSASAFGDGWFKSIHDTEFAETRDEVVLRWHLASPGDLEVTLPPLLRALDSRARV